MALVPHDGKQTLLTIVYPDTQTHTPFTLRILFVPHAFDMHTPFTLEKPDEQTHWPVIELRT